MSPPLSISAFFVLLKKHALLTLGLLGIGFVFLVFAPLGVLLAFLLACALILKKRKLASLLAMLSPFIVTPMLSFSIGIISYATGHAHFKTVGLIMSPRFDRTHRIPTWSSGCMVDGSQLITHPPHNLATAAMSRLFGPASNAYLGPYTTAKEAWSMIDSRGVPVQKSKNQLTVGAHVVPLEGRGIRSLSSAELGDGSKGLLLEDRSLLLALSDPDQSRLYLLDRAGQIIAHYAR